MRDWITHHPFIVRRSWARHPRDFWSAGRQVRAPRVIVLHTTETTGFPGYGGGAAAPHFTIDLVSGRVEQHVPLSHGARALQITADRLANVDGVVQVEIIGAVDPTYPALHGHYDVPNRFPTDPVAQRHLGRLIRAIVDETGIPLVESVDWVVFPRSYGQRAGQRLTVAAWRAYTGLIGHQHVPGNSHGDPGALPVTTVVIPAARDAAPADPVDDGTRWVQTALAALGFDPGPIDGITGPRTRAAVTAYQHAAGIDPDGIPGPITRRHLEDDMTTLDQLSKDVSALRADVARVPGRVWSHRIPFGAGTSLHNRFGDDFRAGALIGYAANALFVIPGVVADVVDGVSRVIGRPLPKVSVQQVEDGDR